MIDISLLRTDPEALAASFVHRGLTVDVPGLVAMDEGRRRARAAAEELRAEQNRSGKEIAQLKGDDKQKAIAAAAELSERYKAALAEADELDARFEAAWVPLPNPPHASVPKGVTDADNVVIKTVGEPRQFDFPVLDHVDLGERLGILDMDRGAKVSGSRFAFLKGQAVLLEFALVQWALRSLMEHGFTPVVPPVLVRDQALFGTGFFPGAREQVYAVGVSDAAGAVTGDDLFLVGTAEVPLAGMHADEILEGDFPQRYAGFSTCFRREAGTYGKDTRGIFRVHQFDKVEMFSFTTPDRSWDEHEALLAIEESLITALGIPYRVVNVCSGDLGDSAAKKYDIEGWFPGQQAYRELTSCSNTTDYQARRLRIRHRHPGGDAAVAHTLNGTAVAVGRTLIALLENGQQADGSVVIPEVLRPFTGFETIG
ncbi:MAG TPA: serine--tRNA ligase [Acidimicrobiia bacterium]|nr:serine--tRNA ligase [Acidimicrobiia bacterium]